MRTLGFASRILWPEARRLLGWATWECGVWAHSQSVLHGDRTEIYWDNVCVEAPWFDDLIPVSFKVLATAVLTSHGLKCVPNARHVCVALYRLRIKIHNLVKSIWVSGKGFYFHISLSLIYSLTFWFGFFVTFFFFISANIFMRTSCSSFIGLGLRGTCNKVLNWHMESKL